MKRKYLGTLCSSIFLITCTSSFSQTTRNASASPKADVVSATNANRSLSNLTSPTAINQTLLPGTSNSIDLGSSSKLWRKAYFAGDASINGLTIGKGSGAVLTNTALGSSVLFSNTTGAYNTVVGYQSLYSNTIASYNTANGYYALRSNTFGAGNTATGYTAMYTNTTGYSNVAYGSLALYSNIGGSNNTAIGTNALLANSSGNDNTALGRDALFFNGTGYSNVAIGTGALKNNSTGHNLVAVGDSALFSQGTGADFSNTAVGSKALFSNSSGYANTATGYQSLYVNTVGFHNTGNGAYSLYLNTTGFENTAAGTYALIFNTTGYENTANGAFALSSNTTGYENTANGAYALNFSATGNANTANGYRALYSNTGGGNNTANGYNALYFNTTGNFNSAHGSQALYSNTTGKYNTADGTNALLSNTTGNYNTAIGYSANVTTGNLTNAAAIGYNAAVDASNKVRIGNTSVTSIGGQVNWTTFSDGRYKKNIKEDVKGLSFINSLRPVTYTIDVNSLDEYFSKGRKQDSAYEKSKALMKESANEAAKIVYNGFLAQEVEAAAKKLNYNFSGVDKPKTDDGLYGLRYSDFVVPLVKAVQELSKKNDEKDEKIDALQKQIDELKAAVLKNANNTSVSLATAASISDASLAQNIPNPFSTSTTIHYTLPQKFSQAYIVIVDQNGKTIKKVEVNGSGKNVLQLDASSFSSGTYRYSLYVDGKMIDSKQMMTAK